MLSVTCNNVSANDVMVRTLAKIIVNFPGPANRVRCQAHIVNLVVQIILRQFDTPKKNSKSNKGKGHHSGNKKSDDNLQEFNGEDIEEHDGDGEGDSEDDDDDDGIADDNGKGADNDGVEDAIEDVEEAMAEELKKAAEYVKPVQKVLSKVRFYYINLSITAAHPRCLHCHRPRTLPALLPPPDIHVVHTIATIRQHTAMKGCEQHQKLIHQVPPTLERNRQGCHCKLSWRLSQP